MSSLILLIWLTSTDILSNIRRRVSSLRMWYLCFSTLLFSSSTRSCLSLSNLFFFPANRDSISHSNWSSWRLRPSMEVVNHPAVSSRSFCAGSSFCAAPSPSFEYALVLVSRSTTLNLSICVSISLRYSSNVLLSLISPDAIQLLIWSRNLCSFLISFLRSASYFSFWLLFVALCTFCQMSSNVSTPSVTFLRHRSISPCSFRVAAMAM